MAENSKNRGRTQIGNVLTTVINVVSTFSPWPHRACDFHRTRRSIEYFNITRLVAVPPNSLQVFHWSCHRSHLN